MALALLARKTTLDRPMDNRVLQILRCVETQQPLTMVDDAMLERLNEEISRGRVSNRNGQTIERPLSGALLNESQSLAYPIFDGIPVMIGGEAIELDKLEWD